MWCDTVPAIGSLRCSVENRDTALKLKIPTQGIYCKKDEHQYLTFKSQLVFLLLCKDQVSAAFLLSGKVGQPSHSQLS